MAGELPTTFQLTSAEIGGRQPVVVDIEEKISGLQFDAEALETSFAQMGRPLTPDFIDTMRATLRQYATAYKQDLTYSPLDQKGMADQTRTQVAATRKAFELLGQGRAVLDVEVTVASNLIMQDLRIK